MLNYISRREIAASGDPYYRDRWAYFSQAVQICRDIPSVDGFTADDVLEIGPYKLPVVRDCHTMDNLIHGEPVTYLHDATKTPWPITDGRYRLLIALQVWEHLRGKQQEAFREVCRVADWAILSVPYKWPTGRCEADHADISEDTMLAWTGRMPLVSHVIAGSVPGMGRLMCLYDISQGEGE